MHVDATLMVERARHVMTGKLFTLGEARVHRVNHLRQRLSIRCPNS